MSISIVSVEQCAALRSQLDVLKKQLDDCMDEKERYHSDLVAAENRAERAQSTTIDVVNRQKEKAGAPQDGQTATEDTERKPSSPSVSGSVLINGGSSNAKLHLRVSNVSQQVPSHSPTPGPDGQTPAESTPALLPESVKRWEKRITQLEDERNELQKKLLEVPTVS